VAGHLEISFGVDEYFLYVGSTLFTKQRIKKTFSVPLCVSCYPRYIFLSLFPAAAVYAPYYFRMVCVWLPLCGSLFYSRKKKKLIVCRSGRNEPAQECMLLCVNGAFGVVLSGEQHGCVYGTFLQRDRNRPLVLFPFSRIWVLKHILTHFDHRKPSPPGGFLFGRFPNQEPGRRDPHSKHRPGLGGSGVVSSEGGPPDPIHNICSLTGK